MRLFLSGGGSGEKSINLDKRFALAVGKKKPLLYIPIAIDKEKHPYPECLKWISKTLNPLGLVDIELWTEKDLRERPEKDLKRFGGIYIGGGNTFYLLKELRESGFLLKLEKMIKSNIPVYGGSAGAIICGKTILTSNDKNIVRLRNFDSMNLVRDIDLVCHYRPNMNKKIKQYQSKHKLRVIALPENCGLFVTDNDLEVVGPGSAYLVDKELEEVKPGKKI